MLGGRLGSAHGIEQALIYTLIPVFCLAFGYDMLLIIITTLSQKESFPSSYQQQPKSSKPLTILLLLQQDYMKSKPRSYMCHEKLLA